MFEHFGFLDLCSFIKTHFLKIVASVLILTLVGGSIGILFTKNKSSLSNNHTDDCIYSSSASYFVVANQDATPENSSELNRVEVSRLLVEEIKTLLKTDVCRKYVSEQILEKYTKEEFIALAVVDSDGNMLTKSGSMTTMVAEYFFVSSISNSMLLNMYVETYDSTLSNDILQAYTNYLKNEIENIVVFADFEYIGGTEQVFTTANLEASQNIINTSSTGLKSIIKLALISFVGSVAIVFVVCCFVSLFYPSINRKSDFSKYDINVIGEIKKRKLVNR